MSQSNSTEWKAFLKDSQNYTCDNYYSTNTNHFILETKYPDWQECLNVFENYETKDEYPDRTQYSINPNSISNKLKDWVFEILKEQHFRKLDPCESWAIKYKDGGYQAIHNHTKQPNLISMIMFFDAITEEQRTQLTDGCTYTLMPHADGSQVCLPFNPYPGKVIIFDGKVYHGTYPCRAPRRSFVVNFRYEYITMEQEN